MEPTNIECTLRCPKHGEEVRVAIDCCSDGGCSITRCSHFGEQDVSCSQQCLEGVTHGTHWDAPCSCDCQGGCRSA